MPGRQNLGRGNGHGYVFPSAAKTPGLQKPAKPTFWCFTMKSRSGFPTAQPKPAPPRWLWRAPRGANSATSRAVALPAAVAVRLILDGKIRVTGVHIPIIPEIYEPVLAELENFGHLLEGKKIHHKKPACKKRLNHLKINCKYHLNSLKISNTSVIHSGRLSPDVLI